MARQAALHALASKKQACVQLFARTGCSMMTSVACTSSKWRRHREVHMERSVGTQQLGVPRMHASKQARACSGCRRMLIVRPCTVDAKMRTRRSRACTRAGPLRVSGLSKLLYVSTQFTASLHAQRSARRQVTGYTLVKIFPALSQAAAAHPPGRQRQLGRRCRSDPQRGSHPQHLGHNSCCCGKPAPARIVICIERSLQPAIRKSGRQSTCEAAPARVAKVVPCSCF